MEKGTCPSRVPSLQCINACIQKLSPKSERKDKKSKKGKADVSTPDVAPTGPQLVDEEGFAIVADTGPRKLMFTDRPESSSGARCMPYLRQYIVVP